MTVSDLVHCTNEPNVSIPHLANLLVERTQNANWVVVYKSLLTVHHLLAYGNEVSGRETLQKYTKWEINLCLENNSKFGITTTLFIKFISDLRSISRTAKYVFATVVYDNKLVYIIMPVYNTHVLYIRSCEEKWKWILYDNRSVCFNEFSMFMKFVEILIAI